MKKQDITETEQTDSLVMLIMIAAGTIIGITGLAIVSGIIYGLSQII